MKFVTYRRNNQEHIGLIDEQNTSVLELRTAEEICLGSCIIPDRMLDCIAMGESFLSKVRQLKETAFSHSRKNEFLLSMEEVELLAPIPRPAKNIFCVGKNYAAHAIEMGSKEDIPDQIIVFTKATTTVIGPGKEVDPHLDVTGQLDYEGELAVVIGKKGKNIRPEEALDHVFGYTIINDVTARDLQERHRQYFLGKSLDTTCPMGPWIVHASVIENPNKLHIETRINGEIRQSSYTENFIFLVEKIISILSSGMTLEPGDIIATGTPAGVGKGMNPPQFLKPGDTMEITVEKIGKLINRIGE